ncbi:MAG: hypothetical protein ACOX3A_08160 [bacterium]|jgi:hypothetical protein
MRVVAAGLTAVIMSFIFNKTVLKLFGAPVVVLLVPLIEEATKTGSAFYWDDSILGTHLFFGLSEAFYDIGTGEKRVAAPIFSFLGHGLFGLAASITVSRTDSILLGMVMGTFLHSIWNGVMVNIFKKAQPKALL